MQFGIKSLLGAMVLLAAFVMGVFQFSEEVCWITLLVAHALSPALWVAGCSANQSRGLKTFFQSGLISGIAPWIATFYWWIMLQNGWRVSMPGDLQDRFIMLAVWSSSGVIAIVGGLLGYWVQACCQSPGTAVPSIAKATTDTTDPLAPEPTLDG